MRFRPLPPADDAEVERVARSTARAIARLVERRGLGRDSDPEESDPASRDEPLLAALYAASVRGGIATGPRAGQEVFRFGDRIDVDQLPATRSPRCASVGGLSLHANVAVPARDRARLERLCHYAARPPLATGRLEQLPDGRLVYELRHPWRDGTTHVAFEPLELVEKLATLVPPPRVNLVRYHDVLAPAARDRATVVPAGRAPDTAVPAQRVQQGGANERRGAGEAAAAELLLGRADAARLRDRRAAVPEVQRLDADPGVDPRARRDSEDSRMSRPAGAGTAADAGGADAPRRGLAGLLRDPAGEPVGEVCPRGSDAALSTLPPVPPARARPGSRAT